MFHHYLVAHNYYLCSQIDWNGCFSHYVEPSQACFLLIEQPGMEGGRNCYSDEHYFSTFFHVRIAVHSVSELVNLTLSLMFWTSLMCTLHVQMLDPSGIANWSVTNVDWSEKKWHPKSYQPQDITVELLRNLTVWPCPLHLSYHSHLQFVKIRLSSALFQFFYDMLAKTIWPKER